MSLKIIHVCTAFQLGLAVVCTYEQHLPLSLQLSGSVQLSYILTLHRLHPQPCNSPVFSTSGILRLHPCCSRLRHPTLRSRRLIRQVT